MLRQQRRAERRTDKKHPTADSWRGRVLLAAQDALWYVRNHATWVWRAVGVGVAMLVLMFFMTYTIGGRIYPNVSAMGVNVGGMSLDDAERTLQDAWQNEIEIQVIADGILKDTVRPQQLGFQFDAAATAAAAREVGVRQGFLGTSVQPAVRLTDAGYLSLQEYLMNMTETINTAPYNAGFRWDGDELKPVMGRPGQLLDIAPTLAAVQENPGAVLALRQLTVYVSPVQPDVTDPSAYLAAAEQFARQPFTMVGYDPYTDETVRWSTDRDTLTTWLEVDNSGLALREEAFVPFIEAQTRSLNPGEDQLRYLNTEETLQRMRDAIANGSGEITLRVRYSPQKYVVEAGDTASKIARKTGIPFYLIEQHNPGRDLNILSIGDTLNMPTRDVTMPNPPVPHKRIVVDLEEQELWAYENDQLKFNWRISSGMSSAPTSPGIYQILNHDEVAYGSSFTLCDENSCGQWEMSWFMGMYEVVPGLMNGFHGAVLLPNGTYLNGGNVGRPATFGCVMSPDDRAKALYDWAEVGTVVEIVSDEFDPLSDLAAQTQET
jgi:lipoprotein-anchoring transpeptidase ErfK/SrfK